MERFGRFRALQKHRYAARLICGVNVSRIRRTASARAESLRSICKLRLSEHKGGSGAEKSCTRKRSCPRAHRRASCNCGTHYSKCSSAVYGSRLSLVPTDSTKLASAEGQRIGGCIFIRPESDTCRFVSKPEAIANLSGGVAPNARAAAEYYPAIFWFSLLRVPDKSEFPGTGPRALDDYAQQGDITRIVIEVSLVVANANGKRYKGSSGQIRGFWLGGRKKSNWVTSGLLVTRQEPRNHRLALEQTGITKVHRLVARGV